MACIKTKCRHCPLPKERALRFFKSVSEAVDSQLVDRYSALDYILISYIHQ